MPKPVDLTHTPEPAEDHEHTYEERWYPLDKFHIRRVCVMPECHEREVKRAS